MQARMKNPAMVIPANVGSLAPAMALLLLHFLARHSFRGTGLRRYYSCGCQANTTQATKIP